MDLQQAEDLPGRALALEPYWQEAMHSLRGTANVIDIRNAGLIAGIELVPRPGLPADRAMRVFQRCFDNGLLIRTTGDIIALSPPLICERTHVDRIVETLQGAIMAEAA